MQTANLDLASHVLLPSLGDSMACGQALRDEGTCGNLPCLVHLLHWSQNCACTYTPAFRAKQSKSDIYAPY